LKGLTFDAHRRLARVVRIFEAAGQGASHHRVIQPSAARPPDEQLSRLAQVFGDAEAFCNVPIGPVKVFVIDPLDWDVGGSAAEQLVTVTGDIVVDLLITG
jgi:hypothetical protein